VLAKFGGDIGTVPKVVICNPERCKNRPIRHLQSNILVIVEDGDPHVCVVLGLLGIELFGRRCILHEIGEGRRCVTLHVPRTDISQEVVVAGGRLLAKARLLSTVNQEDEQTKQNKNERPNNAEYDVTLSESPSGSR